MSNAPAGWYEDPSTPGAPRYWDGTAWLAPGARPATSASGSPPQTNVFTPSTVVEPPAESLHAPWDVVGTRRTPTAPAPHPAPEPERSATSEQWSLSAVVAPKAYEAQSPPLVYGPVRSAVRRAPAWKKALVVLGALVALGIGLWWAFTLFFAPDSSEEAPVAATTHAPWSTPSVRPLS